MQPLARRWEARYPGCPPLGYALRAAFPDRWVRFHSLPESKRYAETPEEHAEILRRHNALLAKLGGEGGLLVFTHRFGLRGEAPPGPDGRQEALGAVGEHWRSEEDPRDPEQIVHIFVRETPWRPGALDPLLRAVADWEMPSTVLAPPTLDWLFCPYDGGVDVILPTRHARDALGRRHASWRSSRLDGL